MKKVAYFTLLLYPLCVFTRMEWRSLVLRVYLRLELWAEKHSVLTYISTSITDILIPMMGN